MNSPHYTPDVSQSRKLPAIYAGIVASAIALTLTSCKKEIPTSHDRNPTHSIPQLVGNNFCADIPSDHFDAGVRTKIGLLSGEVPAIAQLLGAISKTPALSLEFMDREHFIKMLQKKGLSLHDAEQYIVNTGAMTFISPVTSSLKQKTVSIYLSPLALREKSTFIEGILNELINVFLETRLSSTLPTKRRTPDMSGGLDISQGEMDGIGIEFTKEYISGLISSMLVRKYSNNGNISLSLKHMEENLDKGIFWDTDPSGYAYEYFYNILIKHGFPVEKNQDLIDFYHFCLKTNWGNIAKNTQAMCQWLNIPVQE